MADQDNSINLFEYQNTHQLHRDAEELETLLEDIWKRRETNYWREEDPDTKEEFQQFVSFQLKNGTIKAKKYVGVVICNGIRINLLPKIFYSKIEGCNPKKITAMQYHILWWLSYCRKIKFPHYITTLGEHKSDFFEVLIYLFAKYTRELLNKLIYQHYEEIDDELPYIKGRLNIGNYIRDNLSRGRWHKINCTHDPFLMDNQFNRVVKHVANLLFHVTGNSESKSLLGEILVVLDEVLDCPVTAEDCLGFRFNIFHNEYETVRDYCYLFLSQSIAYGYKSDLKLFAFLLPMEYVFEDFLFGFLDKEKSEIFEFLGEQKRDLRVQSQSSAIGLDSNKVFSLKPDMVISYKKNKLIADAKYKIVFSDENDPKKRISQSDLYQMLAYAVRLDSKTGMLFYPRTIGDDKSQQATFVIEDLLAEELIKITAFQVPIINMKLLNNPPNNEQLNVMFQETRQDLILAMSGVFRSVLCSN